MARIDPKDYPQIVKEIMAGEHDGDLDMITSACATRLKNKFRPTMRVRISGTKNPTLDGKEGVVLKVNPKRISVGVGAKSVEGEGTPWAMDVYEDGEFNFPPNMLTVVS